MVDDRRQHLAEDEVGVAGTGVPRDSDVFGLVLRLLRVQSGARQGEVERQLDMGRSMLSHIECGRTRPSESTCRSLLAYYRSRPIDVLLARLLAQGATPDTVIEQVKKAAGRA